MIVGIIPMLMRIKNQENIKKAANELLSEPAARGGFSRGNE